MVNIGVAKSTRSEILGITILKFKHKFKLLQLTKFKNVVQCMIWNAINHFLYALCLLFKSIIFFFIHPFLSEFQQYSNSVRERLKNIISNEIKTKSPSYYKLSVSQYESFNHSRILHLTVTAFKCIYCSKADCRLGNSFLMSVVDLIVLWAHAVIKGLTDTNWGQVHPLLTEMLPK